MSKKSILVFLDADDQPSVFDRVVAVDAGADVLFSHHGVKPDQVASLVHGCIFTRSPKDLNRTALFVGGSNVEKSEELLAFARKAMIPAYGLEVSTLLDANGCNTTAASAVRAASHHGTLKGQNALVLGGTGPVGMRVALLLAREGAVVRLGSRTLTKANAVSGQIAKRLPKGGHPPIPVQAATEEETLQAAQGCSLLVACGAAGACFTSLQRLNGISGLKTVIDLNGVPPLGITGIEPMDKAKEKEGLIVYGALGVGATKIRLHRACVARLFEKNNIHMDAEEVFEVAKTLEA